MAPWSPLHAWDIAKKNLFLMNSFFIFLKFFLMNLFFFYFFLRLRRISSCRSQLGTQIQEDPCGSVSSFFSKKYFTCYCPWVSSSTYTTNLGFWCMEVLWMHASLFLIFFKIKCQIVPNTILASPWKWCQKMMEQIIIETP